MFEKSRCKRLAQRRFHGNLLVFPDKLNNMKGANFTVGSLAGKYPGIKMFLKEEEKQIRGFPEIFRLWVEPYNYFFVKDYFCKVYNCTVVAVENGPYMEILGPRPMLRSQKHPCCNSSTSQHSGSIELRSHEIDDFFC